jgi:hypothetical protein
MQNGFAYLLANLGKTSEWVLAKGMVNRNLRISE